MKNKIILWLQRHRKQLIIGLGILVAGIIFVQLFYPGDRLLPFTSIDGQNVSGWQKKDAIWELDQQLNKQKIAVHVGNTSERYASVSPTTIGLSIKNQQRVQNYQYPWYMRLLPLSILWYPLMQDDGEPKYVTDEKQAKLFLEKQLGKSCNIPAKDASLEYKDATLKVISAKNGGTCEEQQALNAIKSVQPTLSQNAKVIIPVKDTKPQVSDEEAKQLAASILQQSDGGVVLDVAGKKQTIAQKDILAWLTFSVQKDQLTFAVSKDKAKEYFNKNIASLVNKPAGQTKITTRDFTVVSKKTGTTGQALALDATLTSLKSVLIDAADTAKVQTTSVAPKVTYTRSYTKTSTGIAALLQHYSQDHPGTYGVSFQELSGQGRSAEFNSGRSFTTASTYKLYVAYGTLRKVDKGDWKWSMAVSGGRDLATCFDDMIVKSDNACAEALLKKLGFKDLTESIHDIGMTSSSFVSGNTPITTASDLALFLTKLETGTLPIKSTSKDRLLGAMKRNVYRQGIPAGSSGTVADKVGFLWALLHDAAIVYSPAGTYVLVIMTDGSSWANIAELTRKIESLR